MQKICIWRDKYYDCFCGVYEIDAVKGETTLLTETIYPFDENGNFTSEVSEWIDKYAKGNTNEIQLCDADEALRRMKLDARLIELSIKFLKP